MDMAELKLELEGIIQDTVDNRPLDSLEMLVVRTLIHTKGIAVTDDDVPAEPTIRGWTEWVSSHLPVG
jgi:aryl carrier-like protein